LNCEICPILNVVGLLTGLKLSHNPLLNLGQNDVRKELAQLMCLYRIPLCLQLQKRCQVFPRSCLCSELTEQTEEIHYKRIVCMWGNVNSYVSKHRKCPLARKSSGQLFSGGTDQRSLQCLCCRPWPCNVTHPVIPYQLLSDLELKWSGKSSGNIQETGFAKAGRHLLVLHLHVK